MKPDWIVENNYNKFISFDTKYKKENNKFLEKTLISISQFFVNIVSSNESLNKNGLLQKIDPRIKIAGLIFSLIFVNYFKNYKIIIIIYLVSLLIAFFSKIKLSTFLKRVWIFIPFFTLIISIPSIFNFISPGEKLITLIKFNSDIKIGKFIINEIYISKPGLYSAGIFIFRVATSISLTMLITMTTKWDVLISALKSFKIPAIFIIVSNLAYRYIHFLMKIIEDMYLAKKSRIIKKQNTIKNHRIITSTITTILNKSIQTAEEVHKAMVSRGFSGDIDKFKFTKN